MKKTFTWWDEFSPRDRRVSPQEMVSELGKIWEGTHGDSVEVEGSGLDLIHGLDGKRGWWTRFMVPHRCVIGGGVFILTGYEAKENVGCRRLIVRPASPLVVCFLLHQVRGGDLAILIGVSLAAVSSFLQGTRPRKTQVVVVLLFSRLLHYVVCFLLHQVRGGDPASSVPISVF
ncbi:hypothetical protein CIPAW_04G113200 [Carya illinoinensis]|uniref:Uncharacterized protein n=1 Tax=Carya illinoinensis TaxID=32201 RepID=A0A8T1QUY4_CARIL|nr:hypothetical protein CIPAW_04G113200 [Carya illinoinensis]